MGTCVEHSVGAWTHFEKIFAGLKPTMDDKHLLAVFIMTCALGLAVVLDLFQLHVHSVIPCLCLLPTEPSPEGLQLGNYVCAEGTDILKFDKKSTDLSCFIFQFMGLVAFWGAKPIKANVTGY